MKTRPRLVETKSGTVAHLRDQGDPNGEPLVLLHGASLSLHSWEPWVELLERHFRVISLDLPGHGLTGATVEADYTIDGVVEFVDELLTQLGIRRFHLSGRSMGGRAAWIYTLLYPERIDRLILIDASGHPQADRRRTLASSVARTPVVNKLMLFFAPRSMFDARCSMHRRGECSSTPISCRRKW